MANRDRRPARSQCASLCCVLVVLVTAAACTKARVKTASRPAITPPTAALATTTVPPTTEAPTTEAPMTAPPTTTPTVSVPKTVATAPPVTVAKKWVLVAQFAASGDKESNTFTITGAPARVTYKASDQFLLNLDTGDPSDDTAIGSCPAGGCAKQNTFAVTPGGWYLHVTAPSPATAFSATLEEYR